MSEQNGTEKAYLAGGCFWCLEALYERISGVLSVRSGFSGGTTQNPSYEQVCTGTTGHAETIEITFNPSKISYRSVLEHFWKFHDPTTLNRQGSDVGEQYRSAIFYVDESQRAIAEQSKSAAQSNFDAPIVTSIEPLRTFWPAETWHQGYFDHNPDAPYCRFVIAPKIAKLTS